MLTARRSGQPGLRKQVTTERLPGERRAKVGWKGGTPPGPLPARRPEVTSVTLRKHSSGRFPSAPTGVPAGRARGRREVARGEPHPDVADGR